MAVGGGFVGSELLLLALLFLQQEDDEMLVPHPEYPEGPQPMEGKAQSLFLIQFRSNSCLCYLLNPYFVEFSVVSGELSFRVYFFLLAFQF